MYTYNDFKLRLYLQNSFEIRASWERNNASSIYQLKKKKIYCSDIVQRSSDRNIPADPNELNEG